MFVVIHLRHTNGGACALCCYSSPQVAPHPRPDGQGPSRHFPYGTTIFMRRLERSPPDCSDLCLLACASGSMVEVRGTFPPEHPEGGSPVVNRATMLWGGSASNPAARQGFASLAASVCAGHRSCVTRNGAALFRGRNS